MDKLEIIKKWKGSKRFTLKFVDQLETLDKGFKPIDGTKTYISQLSHITTWCRTHYKHWCGEDLGKASTKTQTEIKDALEEFFDATIDQLDNADSAWLNKTIKMWFGTVSRESLLQTIDNHISHHRGQMVVYLRLNGIKPPSYIGW